MDIKKELEKIGLDEGNAVVIGSGILNALNLRESKDIDLVVSRETYKWLRANDQFRKKEKHEKEILEDEIYEIGTSWEVVGRQWFFEDLLEQSVVIDGVRYNTLEFLLDVKRSWIAGGEGREKDIRDVVLMEEYLKEK